MKRFTLLFTLVLLSLTGCDSGPATTSSSTESGGSHSQTGAGNTTPVSNATPATDSTSRPVTGGEAGNPQTGQSTGIGEGSTGN